MTTGRINQVATFKHKLRTECACIHLECMQEVLSIEKLQAEAASFTQTRSDLPMLIDVIIIIPHEKVDAACVCVCVCVCCAWALARSL